MSHSLADMESLACRRAVEFAVEIGLRRVIFEKDSAMVINAINQGIAGFSTYGNVIEDIHCQAVVFQSFVFNHVSRSCNSVKDALVKKAKGGQGLQVWLVDPLEDIASLLLFDVH